MQDKSFLTSKVLGTLVFLLGVTSLLMGGGLILGGLTNSDTVFDLMRMVFGALLLYAGFFSKNIRTSAAILLGVGILYLLIGALAFIDKTMFGMIPSGLTIGDIGFHIIAGVLATWVAASDLGYLGNQSSRITNR